MTPDNTSPTPPAMHRITPENPPQFPCWVWCSKHRVWQHAAIQPEGRFAKSLAREYTHWSKERPTVTPDAPTPPAAAPTLPPEVREAIAAEIYGTPYASLQASDRLSVDFACAALAPLWPRPVLDVDAVLAEYVSDPHDNGSYTLALNAEETTKLRDDLKRLVARPAPVTADARELAEKVIQTWEIGGHARIPDLQRAREAAAVLAPVVARLREAEAELAMQPAHVLLDVHAICDQRDKAVAERDQLRAEIVRLEKNLYTGDDAEKQALRAEVERLAYEANDWMRKWEEAAEAAKLAKQEVERLTKRLAEEEKAALELIGERDEAERILDDITSDILGEPIDWPHHDAKWAEAAELASEFRHDVNDLRAQLAAAQEDTKRLDCILNLPGFDIIVKDAECGGRYLLNRAEIDAAIDAARREGGAK